MTYIVQPGDSLWSIAARYGVSAQAIAAANQLANPQMLYIGQTLYIPAAAQQPVLPPRPTTPVQNIQEGARLDRLEREFAQLTEIVDEHRRQIAELNQRVKRLEQQPR